MSVTWLFLAGGAIRTLVTAAGTSSIRTLAITACFRTAAWPIPPLKGGSAFSGTAASATTSTAATPEAGAQFVFGQFAILVFVQLFEGGDGTLDFLGGYLAVAIRIQRGHHREHPHETTGATLPTKLWPA